MSNPEDEIKDLREKNNELVQKVQYWKMTAAQRENEKLDLMKEINELRLKLSRLRSGGAAQARKLDAALQVASEEALSHLVQASEAITRSIEFAKTYMRDRQELDASSPRWSAISGTPPDRVHKVRPTLMGGQSIQPVVALNRTTLSSSLPRSTSGSPNQNRNVTERAVPIRMLQDVYIPLTRIDLQDLQNQNMETETETTANNSTDDLGLNDSEERLADDSQHMSEDEDFDSSRRLEAVSENLEPIEEETTPERNRADNPLEGPSWLLDNPNIVTSRWASCLEPDSTTRLGEPSRPADPASPCGVYDASVFSPTVRRRKRSATPPRHPPRQLLERRTSNNGRILKVLVAKMRLDDDETIATTPPKRVASSRRSSHESRRSSQESRHSSQESRHTENDRLSDKIQERLGQKTLGGRRPSLSSVLCSPSHSPRVADVTSPRLLSFDAPSPNGATDAAVIVSDESPLAGDHITYRCRPRAASVASVRSDVIASDVSGSDVDSGSGDERKEGRPRRARKAVVYKEKPLNRKLRR